MAKGQKTGGRQAGTPNKISTAVRDNVLSVFDQIGGVENMSDWAKENPTQFYALYAKLLPLQTQVSGDPENPVQSVITWKQT
jgi:hypothetical protein